MKHHDTVEDWLCDPEAGAYGWLAIAWLTTAGLFLLVGLIAWITA